MVTLHNNKGIALVTSLLFTLISLGIIMALLTIVIQGTKVSAANKSYKTAIQAGYGAVEVVTRDILPTAIPVMEAGGTLTPEYIAYKASLASPASIGLNFPLEACFNQKVQFSTLKPDGTTNWNLCTGGSPTTPDPKQSTDMTFNLQATNDPVGFRVYSKITDTRCGSTLVGQPCSNSDTSGVDYLDAGGGVSSSSGSVTPQHRPAYFRIEVQSERALNPKEKAELSVLYAF